VTLLVVWWRNRRIHPARNEVESRGASGFPRFQFSAAVIAGLITAPLLIYLYSATQADEVLRAWSQQNQTPSPPPIDYLLGYGLLWIFAFFGARQAWRRKSDWDVLLLVWVGLTLLLLYAPFPLQRRFSLGLHVPIGILAAIGLTEIVRAKWPRRALIGVTLLTSLFIELALFGGAAARDPRIYLTTNEAAALTWLQANAPRDAVVLASPEIGAFIPAFAGQRVVYGHPYETVNAKTREQQVKDFYADAPDHAQLLDDYAVTHIVVGPREKKLGAFDVARLPLEEVFSSGDVVVYRVIRTS
jgi:asparagine N-glycosylation enzyme membrane subunit Stt3